MYMSIDDSQAAWADLSREDKNRLLYLKQKALLEAFLERGAISKAQYDKSLHDLTEKMGQQYAEHKESGND